MNSCMFADQATKLLKICTMLFQFCFRSTGPLFMEDRDSGDWRKLKYFEIQSWKERWLWQIIQYCFPTEIALLLTWSHELFAIGKFFWETTFLTELNQVIKQIVDWVLLTLNFVVILFSFEFFQSKEMIEKLIASCFMVTRANDFLWPYCYRGWHKVVAAKIIRCSVFSSKHEELKLCDSPQIQHTKWNSKNFQHTRHCSRDQHLFNTGVSHKSKGGTLTFARMITDLWEYHNHLKAMESMCIGN